MIKEKTNYLFITKDIFDKNTPLVKASTITAASKMANVSGIVTEEVALEELLTAYDVEDDEETKKMIGLPQGVVENTIGYPVDFSIAAIAKPQYLQRKDEYDVLYTTIRLAHMLRQDKEKEEQQKAI